MRAVVAFALVAALLAPLGAGAGGRVVAVMEDPRGEVTLSRQGNVLVAVPEVDVRRVTFALTDDELVLTLDVDGLAHRTVPYESVGFTAYGAGGGWSYWSIEATWLHGGPQFGLALVPVRPCAECPLPAPVAATLEGAWDADANVIEVRAPTSFFTADLVDAQVQAHASWPLDAGHGALLGDQVPEDGPGARVPLT